MASVFVKVKVTERLPNNEGRYMVGYEYGAFESSYSIDFNFYEEFTDCSIIDWWLEEIELPSEEDIMHEENKQHTNEASIGFIKGANYILNKLKDDRQAALSKCYPIEVAPNVFDIAPEREEVPCE